MLAHLHIRLLCDQANLRNVRRSLDKAPADLYAFYEVAMSRVSAQPEAKKQVVKMALCYLFCAKRPLNTEELLHALSVEHGDVTLEEDAIIDLQFVLGSSAGLIRADTQTRIVGLVHHTLHEYLKLQPEQLLAWPEKELAKACLVSLNFEEFQNGPCDDADDLDARLQKYCFLDYASHHWGHHLYNASRTGEVPEDILLLREFLGHAGKLSASVQVLHMPLHRTKGWHTRFPTQVSALHAASYWGLDKAVTVLLEGKEVDVNHQDSYGETALHSAAQNGHMAVAQLLLDHSADIDLVDIRGRTPVAWASRSGHQAMVELLVSHGADTLKEDSYGWTAFHWASTGSHAELARLLLNHNPGPSRAHRHRALIYAAEARCVDIIRMLLDDDSNEKAEVNEKDSDDNVALTFSVPLGYIDAVRVFLENGADINIRDAFQNTPLHWAIAHPSVARLLLDNGARVDAKNDTGKTALHWAVQAEQEQVTAMLVKGGADVNAVDENNFTPLHVASLQGHSGIVQLLLAKGARPDIEDQDGWTPLHAAVLRRDDKMVDLLVDKTENGPKILAKVTDLLQDGAVQALWDIKAQEKSAGSTVVCGLRYAASIGNTEMVLALLESGTDIDGEDDPGGSTALTVAASLCYSDTLQLLLRNGANVNKPDRNGWTALHYAASNVGGLESAKLLLENGADIEAKVYRWTPLLLAGFYWQKASAAHLLNNGADANAEDFHGRRILHWAAWNNSTMVARLALEQDAHINATDRWGKTALVWAIESTNEHMTELLLQHGADTMVKARDGITALHMAAFTGNQDLTRRLLANEADCAVGAVGGLTALHIAAFKGHRAIVKLFLAKGADSSDQCQWRMGETVHGRFDTGGGIEPLGLLSNRFRRLVAKSSQVSEDMVEGQTSFTAPQLAALGGSPSVLRLFVQHA